MKTELEQEFFNVFGIARQHLLKINTNQIIDVYPEITDRKLLQLLCIYNDMQGQVELCLVPCEYEDTKEMILQTLVNEKTKITDYEEGTYMDVMTKRIQQLFKEEE